MINAASLALIKQSEGFVDHWYPDPASGGQPYTAVYGHTDAAGLPHYATDPNRKFTEAEGEAILDTDLAKVEAEVLDIVHKPLGNNEFGALVSFVFNIGAEAFRASTMVKLLNLGEEQQAADEFPKWVHAAGKVLPGLVTRRSAERALFLTADGQTPVPAPTQPKPPLTVPTVKPTTPTPSLNPLEQLQMNLSWLSIVIAFLPQAQAIEQDIEAEVKLLSSTVDGKTKVAQSIAILEDVLARAKAAAGL